MNKDFLTEEKVEMNDDVRCMNDEDANDVEGKDGIISVTNMNIESQIL